MKILQINKFLYPAGGSETYMFQLTKALQELGHEVKIWGMNDSRNIVSDFPELECANIDYQNQSTLNKANSAFNTIYSTENKKKIAKVLDIFQPDIVHLHNYNFQITPSILPEIKRRGIKIVQTTHDSQLVCPYHRIYNFQRNTTCTKCVTGSFFNCIKDKCFDGSIFKSTIGAIESVFYHKLNYYEKYIDIYISPSQFLANLLSNRIDKEIKVIPNFTEISPRQKPNTKFNKNYYLYYGRISEEKGVLEMIDIFKETDLQLLIIGTGPLEERVKLKVNEVNSIKFIESKYGDELFDFVQNAKYVIQPSKGFENCPMTIIESFALGVPVIGPNHSGFKDLIIDKETGHLIDFNVQSIAISKLREIDQMEVTKLKENIKSYYSKNLSKENHIKNIIKIYTRLTT